MAEIWVANASPIIVLAKAGHLELLNLGGRMIIIPDIVAQEITAGPPGDPARKAIENGWGTRSTPQNMYEDLLEWGLGLGETHVLATARENMPSTAILDDAAARACAITAGIPTIGTLGVILQAKKQGLIPQAAPIIKDLQNAGLYLDLKIIQLALQHIGESWT